MTDGGKALLDAAESATDPETHRVWVDAYEQYHAGSEALALASARLAEKQARIAS